MSESQTQKLRKLLTLALDQAAMPGEIDSAAVKFIGECRKLLLSADYLLGSPAHKGRSRGQPEQRFTFGKFKGSPIEDVDTGYIEWVLNTMETLSPSFRRFLKVELDWRRVEFNQGKF